MSRDLLSSEELTETLDALDKVALRDLAAWFSGINEAEFISAVRRIQPEALPERLRGGGVR